MFGAVAVINSNAFNEKEWINLIRAVNQCDFPLPEMLPMIIINGSKNIKLQGAFYLPSLAIRFILDWRVTTSIHRTIPLYFWMISACKSSRRIKKENYSDEKIS
jgi:hypothetical protein